jgi:hypothetical protein
LPLRWMWLFGLRSRSLAFISSERQAASSHTRPGIALHQQVVHRLAVVLRGVGDVIAARQFVGAVHIHVVLVAIMALAMFVRRENSPRTVF